MARHGIVFDKLVDAGGTPAHLVSAGIYAHTAVPLRGGEFRKVSNRPRTWRTPTPYASH